MTFFFFFKAEGGIRDIGVTGVQTCALPILPRTFDTLQARYGLGSDPYEPRDNILAGTAYIREMYDRFGAPHFLAAYNAGPDRVDAYLAGATVLPEDRKSVV